MKIGLVILAAGYSERMGVLKPLLPVGGESALLRAVCIGKSENVHLISVVTGFRHEDIEAELLRHRAKNIRHVYNGRFDDGMFSSVKAGVHSLPSDLDGFFLLPADLCAILPETLDKIIAAFILERGDAIVYPTFRGLRGHPPLIPYGFTEGIKSYGGDGGMQGYLARYPAVDVEVGDGGILLDMDTPAGYAALLKHLGLPTYPDEKTCRDLQAKYGTPENVTAHCDHVRSLALRMAGLLREKGVVIDEGLLASACLLHDMVRQSPEHARAGSEALLKEGYPDTAMLVASHMELPQGYTPAPDALALLYLSDKLSRGVRTVPLETTLEDRLRKYAGDPPALERAVRRMGHAQAILDLLRGLYGISYEMIAPPETV